MNNNNTIFPYSFEVANTSFADALNRIQLGENKIMRIDKWGIDVYIFIQSPDENSKMTAPYLAVKSRFGIVPWIPTQIEMLTERWDVGIIE